MKTIYLCGPITGLSGHEARYGWRREVTEALAGIVECLSPMRHYDHLTEVGALSQFGNPQNVLTCPRGIITRDRFDTMRADLLFCNLLGAKIISVGSMIELGWADAARIPVLLLMEESGNLHDHAMVNELTGFRCSNLTEGIELAKAILTPGV